MKYIYPLFFIISFSLSLTGQVVVDSVLGPQELAILPFDYAQDGNEIPIAEIDSGMFTAAHSIKAFFDEVSYGKMSIQGTVYPYRTNQPALFGTGYTNCYPTDNVMTNQADVDYTIIDNIILMVHDTVTGKSCSAGLSSFGKLPFTTADGNFSFRRSGFRTPFYFPRDFSRTTSSTVAHELMHSFGLGYHSNSYIQDSGVWKLQGYGNVFDILGLRSQASHPCSMIKPKLGWLTSNEIRTVTQTDTFRVYALEKTLPGQTQALIIELDSAVDLQPSDDFEFDRLYIEYRGLTGFDERSTAMRRVRLKDNSYYANQNIHGASIIGVDCTYGDDCLPRLIDMHPAPIGGQGAAYFPHEASDAPLLQGESYMVPNNGIQVEVVNVNQGWYIDVVVSMPGACVENPEVLPDLRIFPSPVKDLLQIEDPQGRKLEYKLNDLQGNLILQGLVEGPLAVSDLEAGVYLLMVREEGTSLWRSEKVLKH